MKTSFICSVWHFCKSRLDVLKMWMCGMPWYRAAISMTTKAKHHHNENGWKNKEILLIFPCFVVCADGIRMLLKHFYLVISCEYEGARRWQEGKQTIHLITPATPIMTMEHLSNDIKCVSSILTATHSHTITH